MGEAGILAGLTMPPLTPEKQARERIDARLFDTDPLADRIYRERWTAVELIRIE